MKIYNKFAVVKWEDIGMLNEADQKIFLKLFHRARLLGGHKNSKYFVIGQGEKFAPAVKALIKAYCN